MGCRNSVTVYNLCRNGQTSLLAGKPSYQSPTSQSLPRHAVNKPISNRREQHKWPCPKTTSSPSSKYPKPPPSAKSHTTTEVQHVDALRIEDGGGVEPTFSFCPTNHSPDHLLQSRMG